MFCSQAALAFARLKNAKKKTPVAQAITLGPTLKVEFMKNKKQKKAHRQEEKVLFVKKQKRVLNGTKRLCG